MQSRGLWSLNHDFTTSLGLNRTPNSPKIHTHLQRHISVRVHPHVHPQHIKVLKYFVFIFYGCGMQSTGLWSLNHDFTISVGVSHTLNFPKIHTHLQRHISVRVDPYAHPQHIRAPKCFVYIWYGWGCSLWGCGGPTNRQNNKKKIHQHAF